jgi:rod shape-determining protein MreD
LGSIKPNLLLILVSSLGFIRGKKSGMRVGLVCGLFADVFWGNLLGFYTLIFIVIGYINGMFRRLFYDEDIKLPLLLVGMSEFIYGVIIYICMFMLKGEFNFGYYLFNIILPELIYTVLATLVLYQIILRINRKLVNEEQRSASRFV